MDANDYGEQEAYALMRAHVVDNDTDESVC